MSHFQLIASGVDVSGVVAEIEARPEMWDAYKKRGVDDPESPHFGVSDIWLRYRPERELTEPKHFHESHIPEFWPAWRSVPALHPIVRNLSHAVNAVQLGGILITRIRPGASVKPHIDPGWHAGFFNLKAYLCLKTNALSLNWVEDEPYNPHVGDVFTFDNQKVHSVTNEGKTDRMTAIICYRVEP